MARPMVIWRGHGDDQAIYATEVQQGVANPSRMAHGSASRLGIAAARLGRGGGWLAAWRGANGDNRIWMREGDGGWATQQRRPPGDPRTEDRPALTTFGNLNAMAWRGADQDQHLWFATSDTWQQRPACDGQATSTHGPALAPLPDGLLLMAWREAGANQQLRWSVFDGSTWTPPAPFAGGSTHGPALAAAGNGDVVMAWKGSGSDDHIWCATFRDGGWGPQRAAVGRTSHGPALAAVDGRVVMAWKGVVGDERIWWSTDLWNQRELKEGFTTADTPAVTFVDYAHL